MGIMEAIHTLRGWFIKNQLKLPRVTLTFDDPKDFYGFQFIVRNEMNKNGYQFISTPSQADMTHGTIMNIQVDVKCPAARSGDVYHRGF